MKNYEVTFIVDPVLSGEEIKATAQTYVDHLTSEGCNIVHVDEMGLRQLAYPINKRSSGVYYCVEFESPSAGELLDKMELALRRDERIMRFLAVTLDKYGVKYNADKRAGLIGKKKKKKKVEEPENKREERAPRQHKPATQATPPAPPAPVAPAAPAAPAAAAPVAEEEE
ncbi:MAG: 30S ribosomal protein S6 [Phaeodactylibacter sp.]|nr:30S ribosomal protein S6 [Phaeodactylibacter sp.]